MTKTDKQKVAEGMTLDDDFYGDSFYEEYILYWKVRNTLMNKYLDYIRLKSK
jgi:hypothetical protein